MYISRYGTWFLTIAGPHPGEAWGMGIRVSKLVILHLILIRLSLSTEIWFKFKFRCVCIFGVAHVYSEPRAHRYMIICRGCDMCALVRTGTLSCFFAVFPLASCTAAWLVAVCADVTQISRA
jgi:hypothetical protein